MSKKLKPSFWSEEYFYFRVPIEFSDPIYTNNRVCYHPVAGRTADLEGSKKSFNQERVWFVKKIPPTDPTKIAAQFKIICSYTPCLSYSVSAVGDTYYKEPYFPVKIEMDPKTDKPIIDQNTKKPKKDYHWYTRNYGIIYTPRYNVVSQGMIYGTNKVLNLNSGIQYIKNTPGVYLMGIQKIPKANVKREIANLTKQNNNVQKVIDSIGGQAPAVQAKAPAVQAKAKPVALPPPPVAQAQAVAPVAAPTTKPVPVPQQEGGRRRTCKRKNQRKNKSRKR